MGKGTRRSMSKYSLLKIWAMLGLTALLAWPQPPGLQVRKLAIHTAGKTLFGEGFFSLATESTEKSTSKYSISFRKIQSTPHLLFIQNLNE